MIQNFLCFSISFHPTLWCKSNHCSIQNFAYFHHFSSKILSMIPGNYSKAAVASDGGSAICSQIGRYVRGFSEIAATWLHFAHCNIFTNFLLMTWIKKAFPSKWGYISQKELIFEFSYKISKNILRWYPFDFTLHTVKFSLFLWPIWKMAFLQSNLLYQM